MRVRDRVASIIDLAERVLKFQSSSDDGPSSAHDKFCVWGT